MGGHTDLMYDGGDQGFQALAVGHRVQSTDAQLANPFHDVVCTAGLGHKEIGPKRGGLIDHIAPGEAGNHQDGGMPVGLLSDLFKQLKPIQPAEHQVGHQHIHSAAAD